MDIAVVLYGCCVPSASLYCYTTLNARTIASRIARKIHTLLFTSHKHKCFASFFVGRKKFFKIEIYLDFVLIIFYFFFICNFELLIFAQFF